MQLYPISPLLSLWSLYAFPWSSLLCLNYTNFNLVSCIWGYRFVQAPPPPAPQFHIGLNLPSTWLNILVSAYLPKLLVKYQKQSAPENQITSNVPVTYANTIQTRNSQAETPHSHSHQWQSPEPQIWHLKHPWSWEKLGRQFSWFQLHVSYIFCG